MSNITNAKIIASTSLHNTDPTNEHVQTFVLGEITYDDELVVQDFLSIRTSSHLTDSQIIDRLTSNEYKDMIRLIAADALDTRFDLQTSLEGSDFGDTMTVDDFEEFLDTCEEHFAKN